uniref:Uncharacterized protein n=1 Tax=Rhizophora mucronata TaxID=61149 RepID=A0A2P2QN54_RHIMU
MKSLVNRISFCNFQGLLELVFTHVNSIDRLHFLIANKQKLNQKTKKKRTNYTCYLGRGERIVKKEEYLTQ